MPTAQNKPSQLKSTQIALSFQLPNSDDWVDGNKHAIEISLCAIKSISPFIDNLDGVIIQAEQLLYHQHTKTVRETYLQNALKEYLATDNSFFTPIFNVNSFPYSRIFTVIISGNFTISFRKMVGTFLTFEKYPFLFALKLNSNLKSYDEFFKPLEVFGVLKGSNNITLGRNIAEYEQEHFAMFDENGFKLL